MEVYLQLEVNQTSMIFTTMSMNCNDLSTKAWMFQTSLLPKKWNRNFLSVSLCVLRSDLNRVLGRGTYGTTNDWTQTDPQDGKIVIAWSAMENYPYEAETTTFMESLGNDLGCVKTVKVDRADLGSTSWTQGLMFLWDTHTTGGCWSALGQVNGYTGGASTSITTLSDTGAPNTWQVIAMSNTCGGGTAATVHHEVLHALGVGHEHNRPDRDDYLNVYTGNSVAPDQYYKIEQASWLDTGYAFELASVMTYCSFCSAVR